MADGLVTWRRLQGPDFLRVRPNVYVGAAVEVDLRVRIRALHLWSDERATVAGPLAAQAYGADCPWDDAELIVPVHLRSPGDDVRLRVDGIPPDELASRFGCPVTTPVRTAFDLARREPLVEAVAAVDALAFRCRFGEAALRQSVSCHPGVRGLAQVRRVLELMDGRAESCMETRLRLALLFRGVPPPIPQYAVMTASGQRRLDLAWPDAMFALEYDGPEHRSITGQNRDAFRDADLEDLGWELRHVPSAMVLDPAAADALAVRVGRRVR